jgi:hypothetical protein
MFEKIQKKNGVVSKCIFSVFVLRQSRKDVFLRDYSRSFFEFHGKFCENSSKFTRNICSGNLGCYSLLSAFHPIHLQSYRIFNEISVTFPRNLSPVSALYHAILSLLKSSNSDSARCTACGVLCGGRVVFEPAVLAAARVERESFASVISVQIQKCLERLQSAFMLVSYLRLCRNYFCACGFAAQKHIFAAAKQRQNKCILI